jgi:transposase|tara:strand:+ start:115 stop:372 length:258 start_codon:yes stop_codon:yes gene_type:complete
MWTDITRKQFARSGLRSPSDPTDAEWSATAQGFELLPRRWVVQRTFAWLNRNRRLAKDFERTIQSATARLFMATVQLRTRRIASH